MKRTDIIDAALMEFSSLGFRGASLSKIAARADTNKQLITHHFGTKINLWREVVNHELKDGVTLIKRVRSEEKENGPLKALDLFIDLYVKWVASKTEFQRVLNLESQAGSERLDWFTKEHILPSAKVVKRLLTSCQKQGHVRSGHVGRLYFTLLHLASSPVIGAYQYKLHVKRSPTEPAELDFHRNTIRAFLEMESAPHSLRAQLGTELANP